MVQVIYYKPLGGCLATNFVDAFNILLYMNIGVLFSLQNPNTEDFQPGLLNGHDRVQAKSCTLSTNYSSSFFQRREKKAPGRTFSTFQYLKGASREPWGGGVCKGME